MKKKFLKYFLAVVLLSMGLVYKAYAICPICTVAVAAGLGLSHWLGVDDTISGIWVGGFLMSLVIWTILWLDKKHIRFFCRKPLILVLYYGITLVPLYSMDVMGHPLNKLWGMDKLLLGTLLGSVFFLIGSLWYIKMKAQNGGKAYFPFQKVVMPVAPLVLLTIIFVLILYL